MAVSISFLFIPKIWDFVPSNIKLSQSLSIFKRKKKKWVPLQCQCRICKIYLQHVGFMQWKREHQKTRCTGMEAFLLSVFLINVWTSVYVFPVCSHWFEKLFRDRFHLLFSDRVYLCYYCAGYTIIYLCKSVVLIQR